MLPLFILQISNLLFANENKEAKTEVSTEVAVEKKEVVEKKAGTAAETKDDVVATVNGEEIFRKELDRRLGVFKRMNREVTRAVKIDLINRLAERVLLKQFIEGQDIGVSGAEIQAYLEGVVYRLKADSRYSDKSLEEILKTQGSSIGELEDSIRDTLALGKYYDQRYDEEDKISYFKSNISVFNGERVKASHILIDTTKLKTAAELENAKQKIEEIKEKIDNGADFAETAREYSACSSAKNGGDMDFFPRRSDVSEVLAEVAFSMEVGEISEPVKTKEGYHIIKVTDKEEGKDVSYKDVADMVDFVYMGIKLEELQKRLYKKAEIEITL
jgi:parvulin-like peptidyl-prolyl isomerase